MTTQSLAEKVKACDPRAVARAISLIESRSPDGPVLISNLFGFGGHAKIVGITGAPGVGKSTLVDCLTVEFRRRDTKVGILAIDPTSPFSGGAILGDRIRMQSHTGDTGVFVRSMASRGHLGGLSQATNDATVILDAAGLDVVLIETVGVGQGEVDIIRTADISIVVVAPGSGDDVQALKAGIMEIADVFVVNKSDRDGVDRTVKDIETVLMLKEHSDEDWRVPVLKTEATSGIGISDVIDTIEQFREGSTQKNRRLKNRAAVRLRETLSREFMLRLEGRDDIKLALDKAVDRISRREVDPYTAAAEIMERVQ